MACSRGSSARTSRRCSRRSAYNLPVPPPAHTRPHPPPPTRRYHGDVTIVPRMNLMQVSRAPAAQHRERAAAARQLLAPTTDANQTARAERAGEKRARNDRRQRSTSTTDVNDRPQRPTSNDRPQQPTSTTGLKDRRQRPASTADVNGRRQRPPSSAFASLAPPCVHVSFAPSPHVSFRRSLV